MADFMVVIVAMIAWLQVAVIGGFLVFAGAAKSETKPETGPYQPMRILTARAAAAKAAAKKAAEVPAEHRAAA